jgi:hypothetical protein
MAYAFDAAHPFLNPPYLFAIFRRFGLDCQGHALARLAKVLENEREQKPLFHLDRSS